VLRADFHRPGGPRGEKDKADADLEAERLIRARLQAFEPSWRFLGEETGAGGGAPGSPVWLVDPNDGTRDYLLGRRGSAVSIGLAHEGRARLGVVYAFAYPDDRGDLFEWAEGCGPLRRQGRALEGALPASLGASDVVLLSSGADRDPEGNLRGAAPARYRTLPSIAHRLAVVAAGEAAAAASVYAPGAWDYAAGQALLHAAGGRLVDERGREVGYDADGRSSTQRAFAGSPAVALELSRRPWELHGGGGEWPVRLRRGEAVTDSGRLARAQGCLLGQVAGDSLGSLVEFESSGRIASVHRDGPRRLEDGGVWQTLAGQPTDDSEMALALARSIVARDGYDAEAARAAYGAWLASGPFDVGDTVRAALEGRALVESQANGSLMRASPLGVLAHALAPAQAAELGSADSALTHPHPVCRDAVSAYVIALAAAVGRGLGPQEVHAEALAWARAHGATAVAEGLSRAAEEPPGCDTPQAGWVLVALQNAFFELLHARSLEDGVVATVRRGGDTDTNAAIAGALLGAVHGRDAVPAQWRVMVLSCRAHRLRAHRPRPREYWPVDVMEIAERLLLAGEAAAARRSA
jgi:ADP-ribosylglycohydrolase/fructose-1,6-bisphosphatase/inositol monophosphatase family enzyme